MLSFSVSRSTIRENTLKLVSLFVLYITALVGVTACLAATEYLYPVMLDSLRVIKGGV